jgi:HAD superfamily hydrolase (TIGR01509 family)
MSAVLFGSISTLADTSELQREAFNQAFLQHGLDWRWEQEEYRTMLGANGGADRIDQYASTRGESVDAAAVHATKSQIFQQLLTTETVTAREGVVDALRSARAKGDRTALVTTTSAANIDALLKALDPDVSADSFDLVVDAAQVSDPKPDPAAYLFALEKLGTQADDCVAIEDNPGGVSAAKAAGIRCLAFPNANTAGQDFSAADATADALTEEQLDRAASA